MKILLLGSTGFIGSHLLEGFKAKDFEVDAPRVEIRNLSAIREAIKMSKPDAVVNAAGITGKPNVDWCETHQDETFSVNVAGCINVAKASYEAGIHMTQIGSGCIYDGEKEGGYTEEDEPNFFGSVYSRSRVLSEKALKEFSNVLILRIRIPIIGKSHPKNLIDKLKNYAKIISIKNSCTVIEDLVPATIQLIEMKATGLLNMTNSGVMDHEEIMNLYKNIVDPTYTYTLMQGAEANALCGRRSNCVLSSEKREKMGVHMPSLSDPLALALERYKKSLSKI